MNTLQPETKGIILQNLIEREESMWPDDACIRVEDFLAVTDFHHMLARPRHGDWLPTEVVVTEPQFVVPERARKYSTACFLYREEGQDLATAKVFDHGQVVAHPEFNHGCLTPAFHQLEVHEVWVDTGDDGHTVHDFMGYAFRIAEPRK